MTAQGQSRCPPPGTQFAFGAESSQANPSTMWYYDGGKVYLQIADYTGNHTTFDQCAYTILAAYRDHVLAGGEASHAWHVFPHGLRMAYERTKDDRYKLAVHQLAYNTLVSPQAGVLNGLTWGQYFDPMLPGTPESGIRELAYITQAYIASEQLGEPRHPQLSRAVDSLLGHFDVLFRNHTWALHQTFYDGLAAAALIEYFELTKAESPDWRIPEAIRQMCDWIWDRAYDQNRHQLVYNPDPSGLTCKATGDPTADCQTYNTILINLVAPAFAWYWSITGDETYLQRGDELFQHALDTEPWSTKEFNQAYRWSFDYVKWRTRGRPVGGGAIDHVSVASASVTGGSPVSGTVFLRDVAASTTTVTLSQSGGAALQLPTSVDVPAGAQSAQFSLVTPAVSASQIVTITARLGETSAGINLTVMPPAIASVYVASALNPGSGAIAVYLNAPAPPSGSTVRLASSNPAVIVLPTDVTFPAGTSRLNVPIVVNTVTAPTSVTISATLGKTVSATTTCQPVTAAIQALTLSSGTVTGGAVVNGFVSLKQAAASTTTVTLSQSGGAALQLPTSVDVPAGAQSAQFSLVTPAVSASQIVTITARLGETSAGINLTVMPPAVASVYIASELKPGKGSIAVYLNAPAPPGGSTVRLASSNPAVIVLPSDVTFPAGTSRLNVPIVVNTVTAPTSVTISATLGKTVSATTTCQPKEK